MISFRNNTHNIHSVLDEKLNSFPIGVGQQKREDYDFVKPSIIPFIHHIWIRIGRSLMKWNVSSDSFSRSIFFFEIQCIRVDRSGFHSIHFHVHIYYSWRKTFIKSNNCLSCLNLVRKLAHHKMYESDGLKWTTTIILIIISEASYLI